MKKVLIHMWFCSFFCVFLLFSWPSSSETLFRAGNEKEFTYGKDGNRGPDHWGDLGPEWQICKTGTMQSPIDLLKEKAQVVSQLGDLKINYKASNAALINRGHDKMLKLADDAGYMELNGTQFSLKQCHWHLPSEHAINGKKFDLEAHLVHQSPTGTYAVVGILYQIGESDNFLSTINQTLVDPALIKMDNRQYYRYNGSFTTPPCNESVIWTVIKEVKTVSAEQLKFLRVHNESDTNARPLQALNNRTIQLQQSV